MTTAATRMVPNPFCGERFDVVVALAGTTPTKIMTALGCSYTQLRRVMLGDAGRVKAETVATLRSTLGADAFRLLTGEVDSVTLPPARPAAAKAQQKTKARAPVRTPRRAGGTR